MTVLMIFCVEKYNNFFKCFSKTYKLKKKKTFPIHLTYTVIQLAVTGHLNVINV